MDLTCVLPSGLPKTEGPGLVSDPLGLQAPQGQGFVPAVGALARAALHSAGCVNQVPGSASLPRPGCWLVHLQSVVSNPQVSARRAPGGWVSDVCLHHRTVNVSVESQSLSTAVGYTLAFSRPFSPPYLLPLPSRGCVLMLKGIQGIGKRQRKPGG